MGPGARRLKTQACPGQASLGGCDTPSTLPSRPWTRPPHPPRTQHSVLEKSDGPVGSHRLCPCLSCGWVDPQTGSHSIYWTRTNPSHTGNPDLIPGPVNTTLGERRGPQPQKVPGNERTAPLEAASPFPMSQNTHTAAHGVALGGRGPGPGFIDGESTAASSEGAQFTLHLLVDRFLLRERIWVVSRLVKQYSVWFPWSLGKCQEALARPRTGTNLASSASLTFSSSSCLSFLSAFWGQR